MNDGTSVSCENASLATLKSCRSDYVMTWNSFISWKRETFYDELIWWWYCNMLCYYSILLFGIKSCNKN